MSLKGLWRIVTSAMGSWTEGKLFIEHSVSIDHDALHVIVGVLVWLAMAAITRRPLSSRRGCGFWRSSAGTRRSTCGSSNGPTPECDMARARRTSS